MYFFETNTVSLVKLKYFPVLSSFASLFGIKVKSVSLKVESPFNVQDFLEISSCVSRIDCDFSLFNSKPNFHQLLDDVSIGGFIDVFPSICGSLKFNNSVQEMNIRINSSIGSDFEFFRHVFSTNNTLKKITFTKCENLLTTKLFLSGVNIHSSSDLVPVISNYCLRKIQFSRGCNLDSFVFDAIKNSSSINQLIIEENGFNVGQLSEVLKSNQFLKFLELRYCHLPFAPIFKSLESNSTLVEVIIRDSDQLLNDDDVFSLVEMLQTNAGLLVFNCDCLFSSFAQFTSVLTGLQNNSILRKVSFPSLDLNFSSLITVFNFLSSIRLRSFLDLSPHCIDVKKNLFCYSPVFSETEFTSDRVLLLQSFQKGFSISNLALQNCRFTGEAITGLCYFIRVDKSLTSLDLSNCVLCDNYFYSIIDAALANPCLTNIVLSKQLLGFKDLLKIFKLFSDDKLVLTIKNSRHFIDYTLQYICYGSQICNNDLLLLLTALKANVSIRRVECIGFKNPSPKGLSVLFEILSINKSVIDLVVSPHYLDIENGIFRFSPVLATKISARKISFLRSFLQRFSIRELTLNSCRFTEEAITILSDLLEVSSSLTSVDFSDCLLSDRDFVRIFRSIISNSSQISRICCTTSLIGFDGATLLSDTLKVNSTLVHIDLSHNSIDNDGAIVLAQSLELNSTIDLIDLRHIPISGETIQRISNDRMLL
ncbi:hypothetical protein GEMRC1_007903 [Eukaryota sp. GEM-RC1]